MKLTEIFVVALMVFVSGCATTTYSLKPVAGQASNIETNYVDGNMVAVSRGTLSTASLGGLKTPENEFLFYVGVKNDSQNAINVIPENISVIAIDSKGNSKNLKVFSAKDYINSKHAEADQTAFIEALSAGAQAFSDASRPTSTTYSSGSAYAYGSGGYANAWGSGYSQTYNQGYNDLKNMVRQQQIQNSFQAKKAHIAEMENRMLKRNTVQVGQGVAGVVMVQYADTQKYIVTIPVESDLHRIELMPEK